MSHSHQTIRKYTWISGNKIRTVLFCILAAWTGKMYAAEELGGKRYFNIPMVATTSEEAYPESTYTAPVPDSILRLEQKIAALAARVEEQNSLISNLDPNYQVKYPLGIVKEIAGIKYIIVLESDEITPQGAFINAYMHFVTPQGKALSFVANKIPLSASGGINGVVELALLKDEDIPLGIMDLKIYGQSKPGAARTKVRFDCSGFIDMVVDAGIEFSKEVFVPEDPETGKQLENQTLFANFVTTLTSWSDLIVDISLPPFQIKSFKGFGFEVSQLSFDFSDMNNPAGIIFPKEYPGLAPYGNFHALWQGIYMRQAVLRMPPELNKGKRVQILSRNLILDDAGLTGYFGAENLIALDDGDIGGWAFSLDQAGINFTCGSLTSAELAGKISLPIMKEGKSLAYAALIDQKGDFLFTASMPEDIDIPMFMAKMTVDRSSSIAITRVNEKMSATALLNGQIDIGAKLGTVSENDTTDYQRQRKGLSLSGLKFEKMMVSTSGPYFSPGCWSVEELGYKGSGLNGFAISLSDIAVKENPDGGVGLGFKGRVNFSGDKYCASASLTLWSERKLVNDKTRYKYRSAEIHEIYLKVDDNAISLEGYFAIFNNDVKYGNGFAAKVTAKFLFIGLSASAMFGEVDDFKYFYVDALADLSRSPITAGAVAFYGFGGGAYSRMKQIANIGNPLAATQNAAGAKPPIAYEPDYNTLFGFKATVALGTSGNPRPFNAKVTFEMNFNTHGGIKNVMFYGAGYFMSELDVLAETQESPVYGTVFIGYDVDNRVFHSNLKVYVNVAGGLIQGINPGYLAGEAVIHVDPNDWYIHIGRPATRVGLKISVLGISIVNGSYFMMGTKIDEMPPPPDKVLEILGTKVASRPAGELSLKGFCFGTSFAISTGELQLLIFYARFDMGLGFDVILADRSDYVCAYNGERPGINGWYAEGQVYAFVEGDIGIKIKIFTKKIKASIIKIGIATLLEAKLPNPFWMRGQVGGYYKLLGGKIKGKCKFEFKLGKLCEFVEVVPDTTNAVESLEIIADITPADGRKEIDVFNAPQVVFNYQVNKPFTISDDLGNQSFKVILDQFKVSANGAELPGSYAWNEDGDVLVFNPRDILPGKTNVDLEAVVHFEELVNGAWQAVRNHRNEVIAQTKFSSFGTGEAPNYIPANNVSYSYPERQMANFYKNEYATGYIQLKQGQEYLFTPDEDWKQYVRFTPTAGGSPFYQNFTYTPGDKKLSHSFPADLTTHTMYKMEIVSIPAKAAGTIDQNIQTVTTLSENETGNMERTENKAVGELNIPGESVIYENYFRTSMYNTFIEKVNALSVPRGYTYPVAQGLYEVGTGINGNEFFDDIELIGSAGNKPLVEFLADENCAWLRDKAYPIIYEGYPVNGNILINWRNTGELGVVPLKAVKFTQSDATLTRLTEDDFASGASPALNFNGRLVYKLNITAVYDWQDIVTGAFRAAEYTTRIATILENPCPAILFNTSYPVRVIYHLPGTHEKTHEATLNIKVL